MNDGGFEVPVEECPFGVGLPREEVSAVLDDRRIDPGVVQIPFNVLVLRIGGRLVMVALVSLATVSTLVSIRNLFGVWPGMEAVRLLVYAGATVAIVWAWSVHRRAQRGRHRAKP